MRGILRRLTVRRDARTASAGLVVMMGAGAAIWPRPPAAPPRTALVSTGTFRDTLIERGTIDAARLTLYGSTIAGSQAKILEIVPEGTAVAEGDVIVRFDAAPFEQAAARETAAVAQADAELVRAGEDVRLEEIRAGTEIETARDHVGAAERAFAAERDGRGPLAIAEAEAASREAARELERSRTLLEDTRALLKDGFVTRMDVDRAEQTFRQAEDRQRVATLRLDSLRTFEQPAAIDKSRAQLGSARKGVAAATESSRARLAQRRAVVAIASARANDARLRLAHAQEQIARTIVRATAPGLVVYRELSFGTDRRKPQPGDEVWPNQPLVAVPDPGQLIVQTRVREIDLHRVSASQRVVVSVDAYPDLRLQAQVGLIGALAIEDPGRAGARFFPVTIRLAAGDARLRTGMTARVDIEVSSQPNAILVPIAALIEAGGVTRCRVVTRNGVDERDVDVSGRNEIVAAIRRGLAPGERVLTADSPAR